MTIIRTTAAATVLAIALAFAALFAGTGSAEPVHAATTCADAPEYMPANACNGPLTERPDLRGLNTCDQVPVQVDAGGVIVGDADRDGRLSGIDCADHRYVSDEASAADCSPEAVATAVQGLTRGEYDGTLSICLGVDEDSPLVDAVLTAVGK